MRSPASSQCDLKLEGVGFLIQFAGDPFEDDGVACVPLEFGATCQVSQGRALEEGLAVRVDAINVRK